MRPPAAPDDHPGTKPRRGGHARERWRVIRVTAVARVVGSFQKAFAVAAALWLSTAWTDPRILLTVPLVVGGFVPLVYKRRRAEPMTRPDVEDEDDWRF